MRRRKRTGKAFIFIILLLLSAIAVGYIVGVRMKKGEGEGEKISISTAILYFSDPQVEFLIPEERKMKLNIDMSKAEFGPGTYKAIEAVIEELIKGPSSSSLVATIPKGTRLRNVFVSDHIAYLDFSREIRTKHWGGSSGELMTVYSIVNTVLDNFPYLKGVKMLIEGKDVETLVGHLDISKALTRNDSIIKKAP